MDEVDLKPKKTRSYVSKRVCVFTGVTLSLMSCVLLILLIMSLNGTLPSVRDWNYIRPSELEDMNHYDVVKQTMTQCRKDLPLRMKSLKMTPDPLVLSGEVGNVDVHYDMTLLADVPEEVQFSLLIQRLNPPWTAVECDDGSGSCVYENACHAMGKIFGFDSCTDMKAGNHSATVKNQLVDLEGPFHWAKQPGNYYAQVRVKYREQPFACVDLTFRIVDAP